MDVASIASMTVAALRKELRGRGQDARGNKAALVARLTAVLTSEAPEPVPDQAEAPAPENPVPPVADEEPIEAYEEIEEESTSVPEPVEQVADHPAAAAEEKEPEAPHEQAHDDILSEEKMKKRALRFGLPWPPPSKAVEKENVVKPPPTKLDKKAKRARDADGNDVNESPKKKLATGKKGKKQTQNNIPSDDERRANVKNARGNGRQVWEEDRLGNRTGREDRVGNRVGREDRDRGRDENNVNRRDSARPYGGARLNRGRRRSPEQEKDLRVSGGVGKRAKNVKPRPANRDDADQKNARKATVPAPVKKVEVSKVSKEELAKREARAKRFAQPPKSVS